MSSGPFAIFYCNNIYNKNFQFSVMEAGIDYPGVSVVFFCHDGQGNFLLGKRSKNSRDEIGRWDPGGGRVDLHLGVIDTLKKEIKEEYDTDVLNYEHLGYRDVHRILPDGRRTHWVALDFKVLVDKSKVRNGEPHKLDDIQWFTLDSLPSLLHSQFPLFLELYKSKLR